MNAWNDSTSFPLAKFFQTGSTGGEEGNENQNEKRK